MPKRPLKVYGWLGLRWECAPAANGNRQTREICAAHSKAELLRLTGLKYAYQLFCLSETGNAEEVAKAMSAPGTVFWRPIDQWVKDREWFRGGPPAR